MERSGPDDARGDAWDDARDDGWTGAGRDAGNAGDAIGDPGLGGPAARFGGRGFEMFDDLDDLEDDPHAYPVAPLPPHERTWRHPSEMGEAAWVRTEPPVTIGRGLLVTSGAIGSALGVAVLYLMLPAGAGTPSAGPEATSSFASDRPAVVTLAEETTSSFRAQPDTTALWTDQPGLTLPASDTPSTVLVMADPEQQDEPLSVAVAIEGASYVVTTANALASLDVAGGTGVHLLGPGAPDETPWLDAELLSVEGDLAFLAPAAGSGEIEVVSFASVGTAAPGQPVTVLADQPAVVPYVAGAAVPELDADVIVEGTPVIDESGALVALCTVIIDTDGAYVDMVPITTDAPTTTDSTDTSVAEAPAPATSVEPAVPDAPAAPAPGTVTTTSGNSTPAAPATPATPATVATAGAWIGLRFDGAPSTAPLTVTGVVAGSPALTAGVMVGERVLAIDGQAVSTIDDLVAVLKKRQPGDVVKLTLAPRATASTGSNPTPANPASSTTTAPTTTVAATGGSSTTTTVATSGSNGGTSGTRSVSVVLGALAPTV